MSARSFAPFAALSWRRLGSFALCSALLFACGGEGATKGSASSPATTGGSAAQDFSAQTVEGKTVRLSDHLGKNAILISFWSTFCEPCLAEFPHLRRIYQAKKDKGFVVLAVSMDGPETIAQVPSFVKRNNLDFPVLLDEDSHIAALYNPKKSAPLTVMIDKRGKVAHVREGYNPGDEVELEKEVESLLK